VRAEIADRIEHGNAIETKTNTEGKAATELICGRLHFEAATDSLVIATLPDVIVLRLGKEPLLDRMRMLVRAIHDELKGGRLGALAVATDLAAHSSCRCCACITSGSRTPAP
jgi:AraC family transcriptional activator of mtrCDE